MSTIYADNPVQTLVERKKQQWAREREELEGLKKKINWTTAQSLPNDDKNYLRSRYVTRYQKDIDYLLRAQASPRRPSLPPLYKNQSFAYSSNEKLDKEMGGETSGYGSDNPNHTPEHVPQNRWNNHQLGYESSSSGREDRLKWGDRGVNAGKFWERKEIDEISKNRDTPGWVKRGLEGETDLVVSNTSPAESPEQDYLERPCTSSSSSQTKTYIRGQNVRLDPGELAQRERRRQIAVAHQEAIRLQLEEREQKRQEEKSRKLREEREEEMRIAKEQEVQRKRREDEERLRRDKEERELKRKEVLKEAIAMAEKEAREVKKLKMNRRNISENIIEVDKINITKVCNNNDNEKEKADETKLVKNKILDDNTNTNFIKTSTNVNDSNIGLINNTKDIIVHNLNNNNKDLMNNQISNNNITKSTMNSNNSSFDANNNQPNLNNNHLGMNFGQLSQENLTFVLQQPLENVQNMQLAFLIPSFANSSPFNSLPIAVPISVNNNESCINTARTENRLLTPTQYRINKRVCDSSTQTDFSDFRHDRDDCREKYIREKLSNLEINYRKERRSRSEFRENVEERPKWGVNRPPTRYLKQSEKDPLYQRRKLRQKIRQTKDKCNYSPHSSDDSQTASPRTYRKRGFTTEKRQSRALWRKNEQLFSENVRVYQTEIIPIESDKDQIYIQSRGIKQCCCKYKKEKENYNDQIKIVDVLKVEHTPRECIQYKTEETTRFPSCNQINSHEEIFDNLQQIHDHLHYDN